MTFLNYLLAQRPRRFSWVGDLARDVEQDIADGELPGGLVTLGQWKEYLENCGACDGARKALTLAWTEYRSVRHLSVPAVASDGVRLLHDQIVSDAPVIATGRKGGDHISTN